MIYTPKFIPLLVLVFWSCSINSRESRIDNSETYDTTDTKISEIVLINADTINRCRIAQLINNISKCKPKSIGINFLFKEKNNAACDSALRDAIGIADNVILAEGFKGNKHLESQEQFLSVAYSTGVVGLLTGENGDYDKYYRLVDHRGKWEMSFPFLLAITYDKARAAELSSGLTPQNYPIKIRHLLRDFKVFNYDIDFNENCSSIENKLVIIGYLGSDTGDNLKISHQSDSAHSCVVIANVVLDILNDLH